MSDFPPCSPSTLATECCTVAIPNTSEWQVVCPQGAEAAQSIPVVSTLGLVLCAVMVGTAAVAMIRGGR